MNVYSFLAVRDKFLKACQEAHHGMRTSRRSTVIYDGLPSPDLRSQPPNFNLSHNNELTGSSVTRVYELPSYQSPVELPTNGNIHEMPASYSPQEMPRFSIPRYTPSDLMPEVAQFSSRPQALEYSSGVMSYAGNSTIHREP